MIQLTKLDKAPILVNLETIKYIESIPDTLIIFTNGDSIIVKESLDQIKAQTLDHQVNILKEVNHFSKKKEN